jgi:septal ring factor EnvC (AmiA/AmiB activator)
VLTSRADEIGAFDRRLNEATMSRGAIETKFAQIEAALTERDAQIRELEEERASLSERNTELTRAVGTRESAYNRAQERIQAQDDLVQMLEGQIKAARETAAPGPRIEGSAAARTARPLDGGRRDGGGTQGHRTAAARTGHRAEPIRYRTGAGAHLKRRLNIQ